MYSLLPKDDFNGWCGQGVNPLMSELYFGMKDYAVPLPPGIDTRKNNVGVPPVPGNGSAFGRTSGSPLRNGSAPSGPSTRAGIVVSAAFDPPSFILPEFRTTTEADLFVRNPFFRDRDLGINPFYTSSEAPTEAPKASQSTTTRLSEPDPFPQDKIPDDNMIPNSEPPERTAERTTKRGPLAPVTTASRTRNGRRGNRRQNGNKVTGE